MAKRLPWALWLFPIFFLSGLIWMSGIEFERSGEQASRPPSIRGLEDFDIDFFVMSLRAQDTKLVAEALRDYAANLSFHQAFDKTVKSGLESLAAKIEMNKSFGPTFEETLARELFAIQMAARKKIDLKSSSQFLENERKYFVLLQTLIEESLMMSYDRSRKTVRYFFFQDESVQVSQKERDEAGLLREIDVLPGDIMVQIGAGYLSSHFIAQSQSFPGLASHALLISKAKPSLEVLEALIEDGVNRRAPTQSDLARFWILSAELESDRQSVRKSLNDFIQKNKIPFVAVGHGTTSPLLYDSSMNPEKVQEGSYFCTALVQEVYRLAGLAEELIPYRRDKSNWNVLMGIERAVYQVLSIDSERVPAPMDALYNPALVVRSAGYDAAGLKVSRRLRATVDAIFQLLKDRPDFRDQLRAAFYSIPEVDVKKDDLLKLLRMTMQSKEVQSLIGDEELKDLGGVIQKMEQSLPQTANLRQIVFFMALNQVLQKPMLSTLESYEERDLKRHATPRELLQKASDSLVLQFGTIIRLIESVKDAPKEK